MTPAPFRRLTCALLGLTLAACKSAPEPSPPPPPRVEAPPPTAQVSPPPPEWTVGAWPAHLPREAYAAAVATSTDAAAAEAKAEAALEVRLLGPADTRPFAEVPDALRPLAAPELTRRHSEEGLTSVLVAAPRADTLRRLEAWAAALAPQAPLPERTERGERVLVAGEEVEDPRAHLDLLVDHVRYRRAARFACAEAPVRTSTEAPAAEVCADAARPGPGPDVVGRALGAFLSAVSLTAEPPGGVPRHPRAGALRPVTVRVTWTSPGLPPRPLADVPVRLDLWGEAVEVRTDADGRARAPVPAAADPAIEARARVDAEALLGELAALWAEPPSAQVVLRTLTPPATQLALAVSESSAGQPTTDGTESLRLGLLATGLGHVFYLDEALSPAHPVLPEAVTALADAAAGRIDLLVLGTFDSHFASQMGARSVWYEATGQLEVYDAWTGQRVATLEDTARAVAIGEAAAARAAVQTLGRQLSKKVDDALRTYAPPAMARAP